ncbi:TraR/DksA family transcriptional regulator [Rhodoferax sp. WC2427]|uniref:TraR/DksA family transcriptional regulator n=1 Tax=Rhodoferax sp. WC2427 TaxID=3234144 RepID=UPI003466A06E
MHNHLSPEQLHTIGSALQARRLALQSDLAQHNNGQSRVDHAQDALAQGSDDFPQNAGEREVDMALTDMDVRELAAINRAEQHLQDTHFGTCVDCAQPIPFERLRVEPQSLRCVACASIFERKL